jgi:hypothetical protein
MVARPVLLLDQLPPDVPSVSVVVVPKHMMGEPDIGTGVGLTVTITPVAHPVLNV